MSNLVKVYIVCFSLVLFGFVVGTLLSSYFHYYGTQSNEVRVKQILEECYFNHDPIYKKYESAKVYQKM